MRLYLYTWLVIEIKSLYSKYCIWYKKLIDETNTEMKFDPTSQILNLSSNETHFYLFRDSSPQSTFHVFRLQALCLTQKSVLFCFVLFVCLFVCLFCLFVLFVCWLVFVSFHLTSKKQSKLLKIRLRVSWLLFLPNVAGDSLGNVKS